MNKKFDRDFFDWHASPRPGRLGPRLLQYTPDAGDGIPGLQWMFRKMLEVLSEYFVIEGCEYSESDSGKVTAGWIFFESKIVEVSEQTSVGVLSSLGDGYFIYINENGVAGNSNVDGTFTSNVISSMREHSTTIDVRFKGHANKFVISHELIVGKNVTFHKDLIVHNDLDVDGISNLDNVDIDGTLDVAGVTDFHSVVDMNSNKITNLAAPTVANDGVRKTYVDIFALSGHLSGTLSSPTVVNDSHTHDTQYYTKTLLNGGQLDNLYYTETELNNGQLDNRYFRENEFLNISAGVGDSGKPIKLDAAGHIDASMVNDGDISHLNITNIGSNSHTAIDTHISSTTLPHISSTSKTNWDAAHSHISQEGSSHTFIDQSLTQASSPVFAGMRIEGDLRMGETNDIYDVLNVRADGYVRALTLMQSPVYRSTSNLKIYSNDVSARYIEFLNVASTLRIRPWANDKVYIGTDTEAFHYVWSHNYGTASPFPKESVLDKLLKIKSKKDKDELDHRTVPKGLKFIREFDDPDDPTKKAGMFIGNAINMGANISYNTKGIQELYDLIQIQSDLIESLRVRIDEL